MTQQSQIQSHKVPKLPLRKTIFTYLSTVQYYQTEEQRQNKIQQMMQTNPKQGFQTVSIMQCSHERPETNVLNNYPVINNFTPNGKQLHGQRQYKEAQKQQSSIIRLTNEEQVKSPQNINQIKFKGYNKLEPQQFELKNNRQHQSEFVAAGLKAVSIYHKRPKYQKIMMETNKLPKHIAVSWGCNQPSNHDC